VLCFFEKSGKTLAGEDASGSRAQSRELYGAGDTSTSAAGLSLLRDSAKRENENSAYRKIWAHGDAPAHPGTRMDRQGISAYLNAFPRRTAGTGVLELRYGLSAPVNSSFGARAAHVFERVFERVKYGYIDEALFRSWARLSGTRLEERRKGNEI